MNTTQLNATYLKRYFYHNFILFFGCFLLTILFQLVGSEKTITLDIIIWEFLLLSFISSIFLGTDLVIKYFYLKPKKVELKDEVLFIDNKLINTANIIAIKPITYSKSRWFINVVEVELKDEKFCFLDQSQFGNSTSKSLKILLEYFPSLKNKVTPTETRRKLDKYYV